MRFRTRQAVPNYLGRREQRRLLTTILLLGLVLFLMHEASKPSNWEWFAALNNPVESDSAPGADIDTRLARLEEPEAVPGAITVPADKPAVQADGGFFPGVRPDTLQTVRDDTVFRGAEHDAFFHLLEVLYDTDQATLDGASLGHVAFVQLYQQPEEYRGKLVSVRGTVRGVFELTAARNDYGIERYYQMWIQPYDNPTLPLVVYVLDLPKDFPRGEDVHEEVQLTGFFYKRWAYRAKDAIRTAPLLLAKTVQWKQPVVAVKSPLSPTLIAGIIALALGAAAAVVWMALRGSSAPAYLGPRPPRRFGAHEETGESPSELFKRLAEQAQSEAEAVAGKGEQTP